MNRSPFDPSIALSKDRLDSHSHGAIYVDRFRPPAVGRAIEIYLFTSKYGSNRIVILLEGVMEFEQEFKDFLKNVPGDGTPIGNKSLRERLKWDEDKYWKMRDELLTEGKIRKSQGKGGAVALIEIEEIKPLAAPATEKKEPYKDERALYSPFLETIETKFTKDMGIKGFICENVSSQGRRNTGGLWTRPDAVIVAVNTFSYYPGKVMDIITFEIKHYRDLSISGVFETASQSRYATKSYFCLYLPNGWLEDSEEYERIKNECERFGVGLLYFADPKNYDSYEIIVEPERKDPDPSDMNTFISIQINDKNKNKIAELLR